MKINSDVDIDLGDRDRLLSCITHTPAAQYSVNPPRRHNTGIYVTDIPRDPRYNMASIDYVEAERRGYFKLDLLNVHLYNYVSDEAHLHRLMETPDWSMLSNREVVEQLVHIHGHYDILGRMPQPVDSIPRLAMFLAIIRPSKVHLIGQPWSEVSKTIWDRPPDGSYWFKKSHSIAYAHLVVVNMNLIQEHYVRTKSWVLPPLVGNKLFGV